MEIVCAFFISPYKLYIPLKLSSFCHLNKPKKDKYCNL
jgi:hypothetical protein